MELAFPIQQTFGGVGARYRQREYTAQRKTAESQQCYLHCIYPNSKQLVYVAEASLTASAYSVYLALLPRALSAGYLRAFLANLSEMH